jgi:hypothetical protein
MKTTTICINIPVKNLERAVLFYTELGFEPHSIFRGPDCQCMIVTDTIQVMVHLDSSLRHFTPKPISDPSISTGAVFCLLCGSKTEVDDLVAKALANGGATYDEPQDIGGFVYTHGFLDADGNVWRLNWMNPDAPTSI